jgi:hypothetical protein
MTKIKTTTESHTGRTPESVTRRVWGRKAYLKYTADPNAPKGQAMVLRDDEHGTHVLANVMVYDD